MRRWVYLLLSFVAGSLAVALLYQPLVEELVLREARRHGVRMRLGEVELGWSQLVLRDCAFELDEAPQLKGHVDRLVIEHHRGVLKALHARGVGLRIIGSAGVLAVQLGDWAARYPILPGVAASASEVTVRWRADATSDAWLVIEDAAVAPTEDGARLEAAAATVAGLSVGPVGARWGAADEILTLGVGQSDPAKAPVLIVLRRGEPHRATVTLKSTPLAQLAGPLGVALPVAGVSASGVVELTFENLERGVVSGSLSATLSGYTPPVPPDLRAFVFGDTSELSSDFEVSADRLRVTLRKTAITHGSLRLSGGGDITREEEHAQIHLDLAGSLPCTALAAAAARTRLGPQLGALLGEVVRTAVRGSVAIDVKVDADTRDLAAAKLHHSVGIGCGLVALRKLPGWPDLRTLPSLP